MPQRMMTFASFPHFRYRIASTFFASGLAVAALAVAPHARAENDDGLEVMVRPAIDGAGSGSPVRFAPDPSVRVVGADPGKIYEGTASPYGAGFVGDVWVGYRVSRFVSLGVEGGMRSPSASAVDDGTTNLTRFAWSVGPYARAYAKALLGFEPWLSVGAQYMHDAQSYDRRVGAVPAAWSLVHHGVALPIGVGLDNRFLDVLGVGPSFMYTPVVAAGGCATITPTVPGYVGNEYCTGGQMKVTEANAYGAWSVGLDVRATLF